ncbi:hypothetical protein VE02_09318 [Pseudogymnoascus sp. 03VT05]|nr:hypothetical protein VE02_09318 [Pseudogymnoascus sp. 03VT05]
MYVAWLAPSSTWSFTARLTLLMSEKLNLEYSAPNLFGEDIYPLQWSPATADCTPDISGLPSIDYALYLFDAVKFHLGQNYRFFDESAFVSHVREFYTGSPVKKAAESRLWFVQFLLVLSFGKAFLSQSRNPGNPPGSKFFVRAMSLMPDILSIWKDSVMAIEVLALAGLYLYSIDHRESAHVYVGQAIRVAQLEGLHTQLPEDELGVDTVMRCRNLWWTLYIMDRHFSSSLGLPMSTPDGDITALIDSKTCSQRSSLLSLQVRLSRLLSFILTTIYKTEQTQLATFLETTRSILHSMVGHAKEMERIIHVNFQSSVDAISKETRHITLLYHQCVIVATRPLLLSVLKERLEKLDQGEEDWQSFLALTKPLISTGIKSAVKTLQILHEEDGLLELFLPFDLEFTYGAAIHLAMANALFPNLEDGKTYGRQAHSILNEMVSKGNKVAQMRKSELSHLETLFDELAKHVERRGLQPLSLSVPPETEIELGNISCEDEHGGPYPAHTEPTVVPMAKEDPPLSPQLYLGTTNHDFLDNIGISSYEFLSIMDQMGNPDDYYGVLDLAQ